MTYTKKKVLNNAEIFYPDIIFKFKILPEKSIELTLDAAKNIDGQNIQK